MCYGSLATSFDGNAVAIGGWLSVVAREYSYVDSIDLLRVAKLLFHPCASA